MTDDIWRLDATAIATGIRAGDFSSREAVSSCLQRLEAVNPQLNAIVETRPEEALVAADAADRAVAAGGELGPLHGVPISVKGNHDLAGWATVNGCAALQDNVAAVSSPSIQNLLDAGVVVIGRSNTPEFCVRWDTSNDLYGATVNPWNAEVSPGGSSGGAAAAVAAGINPMATGTDLGGSLRVPAQACGVASIKPGRGRVPDWNSTDPIEPGLGFQLMNVNGILARSVRDLQLGLPAMAGGSWRDPWWSGAPLEDDRTQPHKIALVLEPGGDISEQVRSGVKKAGELLSNAGYTVEVVNPPELDQAWELWRTICMGELVLQLKPAVQGICGPRMVRCLENYAAIVPERCDAAAILDAFARRRGILRAWMEFFLEYPLMVGPVGLQPPGAPDEDIASPEAARALIETHRLTVSINALGLPAATLPVGMSDGLPQVVQIIGPQYAEMRCLAAAAALEVQAPPITPIDPQ
jgi:amidase